MKISIATTAALNAGLSLLRSCAALRAAAIVIAGCVSAAPVLAESTPSVGMSPQKIADCSAYIKRMQIESQSWGGDVNAVANRLGLLQKGLFGRGGPCAGHPEAQAYIAGANKMLGYGGSTTSGASDQNGGSSSSSANSEVRDYPEPDRNECLQIVRSTRGGQCGQESSFLVEVKNICPEKIRMNLCVWDTKRNRWSCGSSTGRSGEKYFDKVLQYTCESDGRYIYSGCSEQAQKGRFRNGNCGGNPNKEGKHSFISK